MKKPKRYYQFAFPFLVVMAWHDLSYAYLIGNGVEKNTDKSIEFLRKAAELGDQWAMESLGELCLRGRLVSQDHTQARAWLHKAANRACPKAQCLLAGMLIEGLGGHKAPDEGMHWLRLSAAQGHKPAQAMLRKIEIGQSPAGDVLKAAPEE